MFKQVKLNCTIKDLPSKPRASDPKSAFLGSMGEEVLKARIRISGESLLPQHRSPCETPHVYLSVSSGQDFEI